MQTIRITTAQNIDIDYEVASVGDRILGNLIDIATFVALCLLVFAVAMISRGGLENFSVGFSVLPIALIILWAFYDLICEVFFNGQSIGKKAMKIRVISLDGGRPTLGQYLIRWLLRIVDFTLTSSLGAMICVIATEKKQRIGDIAAGTTLVKTHPGTQASHIAFAPPAEDYTPVYLNARDLSDQDIALIHEIIGNFKKTANLVLLYSMADKVKELLNVSSTNTDALTFLETVVRDYNHLTAKEYV
ncbi:MAG: hypothetical protein K0S09_2789 [Sphingobacteriaceae bacterium]|jgi:uncharacterized RDD family membrane protein YckC|nr:hypothetical protein [Sphingobacteriaceae bacterium]